MGLGVFSGTILSRSQVAPGVHLISIGLDNDLVFVPGQYIIMDVPTKTGTIKRLYSIASSSQNKRTIQLFIKIVEGGAASAYIEGLFTGSVVKIQGPAGVFTPKNDGAPKAFLATGTGFAPVRSFLASCEKSGHVWVFWGMQTIRDACLLDELVSLSSHWSGFYVRLCLSREASLAAVSEAVRPYFALGRVDVAWRTAKSPALVGAQHYLCGSRNVVDSLRATLNEEGVPPGLVVTEKY